MEPVAGGRGSGTRGHLLWGVCTCFRQATRGQEFWQGPIHGAGGTPTFKLAQEHTSLFTPLAGCEKQPEIPMLLGRPAWQVGELSLVCPQKIFP